MAAMAQASDLPSEERVRELTADPKLTPEEADRHGDLFVKAGNYAVAMMFYERSKNKSRLEQIKKDAIRLGDSFLLHQIVRIAPDFVVPDEWREAARQAYKEGKLLFARDCYEKAGDAEKAAEVRQEWLKLFPAPAAPKPQA